MCEGDVVQPDVNFFPVFFAEVQYVVLHHEQRLKLNSGTDNMLTT